MALAADGNIKFKDSALDRVKQFVENVAKTFRIDFKFNENISTRDNIQEIARKFTKAIERGREIKVEGDANKKAVDLQFSLPEKKSEEISKAAKDRTVAGRTQPSMQIISSKAGVKTTEYSGIVDIQSLKTSKPLMYISRAVVIAKTHLVKNKQRAFNSTATITQKLKWADAVYNQAKESAVSNLLFIHDNIAANVRNISKLWYDGANVIAQEMSKKYNVSLEQASAIIATQSPQKPWFDNVHLAQFILDYSHNNKDAVFSQKEFDYYKLKASEYPKQQLYLPKLEKAIGKKFSQLNDYDKSVMLRSKFDNEYERRAPLRIPTGDVVGDRIKTPSSFSGYHTILKAVSIIADGSDKNISKRLGNANRVRSFYNNIVSPQTEGEVTIDTHAIAASYMLALGSKSKEVKFDPATYAFFADVYKEAAKQRGILAREMQSITWEGARAIFPRNDKKLVDLKKSIGDAWAAYSSGKTTIEEAQNKIKNYGKDLSSPDWGRHIDRFTEGNESASYLTELPLNSRNRPVSGGQRAEGDAGSGLPRMEKGDRGSVKNKKTEAQFSAPISTKENGDEIVGEHNNIKIVRTVNADRFQQALASAVAGRTIDAVQVDVKDASAYKEIVDAGGKLYLSEDGNFGAFVDATGYMGSLFKNPKSETKGVAKTLQDIRIKDGGRFFDAFGTHLEDIYIKNGFRPVARMKFNEEYAPDGWKESTLKDKPDVVFFVLDPVGEYKKGEGEYFEDYGDALTFTHAKVQEYEETRRKVPSEAVNEGGSGKNQEAFLNLPNDAASKTEAPKSVGELREKTKAQFSAKTLPHVNSVFETRDGVPIGYNYSTDKVARERFDISKLKRLSAGSDRVVFELDGERLLKVAKTARGLAQKAFTVIPT